MFKSKKYSKFEKKCSNKKLFKYEKYLDFKMFTKSKMCTIQKCPDFEKYSKKLKMFILQNCSNPKKQVLNSKKNIKVFIFC
jgi:hypothetical protein